MSKKQKYEFIRNLAIGITILFGMAILASMDVIVERLLN